MNPRDERALIFQDTKKQFETDSELIAAAALKQAGEKYKHHFRTIEFAVYCRPDDDWNYQVFRRALN